MTNPTNPERRPIEIPKPLQERARFAETIVGQDEAVEAFATLLAKIQSGIRSIQPRPIDIKFLAGPSGVGKTEIVYRLAEILAESNHAAGNENPRAKVLKINGGEYQNRGEVARLIGSPPGYIGSEDPRYPGGTQPVFSQANLDSHKLSFTDKRGQTKSIVIILVDEAEKAHPSLHQAFLSVLDKGQMQLSNNTVADFSNAVIFYTSNAGNEQVEKLRGGSTPKTGDGMEVFRAAIDEAFIRNDARDVISEAFREAFPVEFRGRIRELIVFQQLRIEHLKKIVEIKTKAIEREFRHSGVTIQLQISPKAAEWLANQGYSTSEGARALEKVIDKSIRNPLIIAHGAHNFDQKTVVIDMAEYGSEPQFYLVENQHSPDFPNLPVVSEKPRTDSNIPVSTPKAIPRSVPEKTTQEPRTSGKRSHEIPQIPVRVKAELVHKLKEYGVSSYVNKRDELIKRGIITSEAANMQPEILRQALIRTLYRLQEHGVSSYIKERDQVVNAGLATAERVNNISEIKKAARKRLLDRLGDLGSFASERDQLVKAGIGTLEEWNALLNEV